MRFLVKLILVAAAGWSGYWYVGATGQEKLVSGFLEQSREDGWVANTGDMSVTGFPNRFDTVFQDLNLTDPSGEWGWQADEFQVMALSYKPNHVIVAWPGEQVIITPFGNLVAMGENLRGSIVVSPSLSVPLERVQIEGNAMTLRSSRGWVAQMEAMNVAIHAQEDQENAYRIGVDLANIAPPSEFTSIFGGGQFLPDLVERLHLSAVVTMDRPIDRLAFEGGAPQPQSAIIDAANIIWGSSTLNITGELLSTGGRYVDGSLTFEVENWRPLFDVFKSVSHLTTTEKLTLQRALTAASTGNNLTFTLDFSGGDTKIGPFVIGPAPVYPF